MPNHRGNIARLPLPPKITGTISSAPQDLQAIVDHLNTMTTIINQGLQSAQNRLNTIQQSGAKTPPTVTGLAVTGKQGLFFLTWNRINNADGFVIVQASDAGMKQLIGRFNIPDGEACSYSIPVGNVAVTNTFQIYAYQGHKVSQPSPSVTATTVAYGAGESAPPNPPFAPRHPKIAPVRSGPNL